MAVSSSVGTETRGGRTGQDVVGDTEGGGVRAEEVAIGLTRDDELVDHPPARPMRRNHYFMIIFCGILDGHCLARWD